uniref:Serine/threonine-protein kinase SBK2 n=1 Tax=Ailuropoda melanoleuca TaxID=9646 RepID=G1LAX8_AILME
PHHPGTLTSALGWTSTFPRCSQWAPDSPRPHLCSSPTGGHRYSPPTARGADSHQGDQSEESPCPVPPHPRARLRLLWPCTPCPASPRRSCCGSEALASGLGPENHLPERVLCGPLCLVTPRLTPDPGRTAANPPTLCLRPGVRAIWGSQRDAEGTGTTLALKQLPKASTSLRGFLYEFCVGLSLGTHSAIVTAYGIGIESANSYSFLTEPVLYGDLITFIQPKVGLPQQAVQRCADQLASALEHIHSRGLVYRDIKPENVLVCDPACQRVKLTDFGHTRPRGTLLRLAGPPIPYTAPELCCPPPLPEGLPIQPALDAWALGVLLFCLLTGYFPWDQPLAEADPFYEDFLIWQASGQPEDRPQPWFGLTPVADSLLWGLLDPHPRKRSPVSSIQGYLGRPWRQQKEEASEEEEEGDGEEDGE